MHLIQALIALQVLSTGVFSDKVSDVNDKITAGLNAARSKLMIDAFKSNPNAMLYLQTKTLQDHDLSAFSDVSKKLMQDSVNEEAVKPIGTHARVNRLKDQLEKAWDSIVSSPVLVRRQLTLMAHSALGHMPILPEHLTSSEFVKALQSFSDLILEFGGRSRSRLEYYQKISKMVTKVASAGKVVPEMSLTELTTLGQTAVEDGQRFLVRVKTRESAVQTELDILKTEATRLDEKERAAVDRYKVEYSKAELSPEEELIANAWGVKKSQDMLKLKPERLNVIESLSKSQAEYRKIWLPKYRVKEDINLISS